MSNSGSSSMSSTRMDKSSTSRNAPTASSSTAMEHGAEQSEDDQQAGPSVFEEDTSRSLAATLALARAKGYVEKNKSKPRPSASTISSAKREKIQAKAYMVDKRRGGGGAGDDRREPYRGRGGGTSGGGGRGSQHREVLDPEDYKPEITLEYTDDKGKKLKTPKEAFKYMCYNFHGKYPSKGKLDQRARKEAKEALRKQALTTDLPSSAALMISKQEELHTPYIVLSKGK